MLSLLTGFLEPLKILVPEILVGWSTRTCHIVDVSRIERGRWITLCRRLADRDKLRASN